MKAIMLFIILFQASIVFGQESDGTQYNLFKSKTYVKNPLDLRDPFKRKPNKKKSETSLRIKTSTDGYYSNNTNSIESKPIESIRIIGIVVGPQRRAMAKIVGDTITDNIYYLKEGMKIGPNGAEVKAILPGGVVLVEKIRNVYDQDEYLETVIPVSNE
jgi:Tfp pilus assembly protein PilP